MVIERRDCGLFGEQVQVERMPRALEVTGQLGVADAVTDAQAREPVDLREGANHERARALGNPGERIREVAAAHVLDVTLVDYQHDIRRQRRHEPIELGAADARAGRVIGVAQHHHARARRYGCAHRREVVHQPRGERHRHSSRAHARGHDRIHRKGRPRVHDFIAGADERFHHQLEDLVPAAAEYDLSGRDAELRREFRAQPEARAIRVTVHAPSRGC